MNIQHIQDVHWTQEQRDRFWSSVPKDKHPSECWEWLGTIENRGYGVFRIENRVYKSHRLAFFLYNGHIQDDLFICHQCDNRPCVNPHHLQQGTAQDNNTDKILKGRAVYVLGENHPNHKLTEEQALIIKSTTGRINAADIAEIFGVSKGLAHHIRKGRAWKHLGVINP